jgi:hypothetical protein
VNIDIEANVGVRADITKGLGFIPSNSAKHIAVLNPFIHNQKKMFVSNILADAKRILESGGEVTIAVTKGNPYVKIKQFPSADELSNMGFEVVSYKVPLTMVNNYKETFSKVSFGTSDGVTDIRPAHMITIVLRKKQ